VLVLPGRLLEKHLEGRKPVLGPTDVAAIRRRLESAIRPAGGQTP
jgi:hypothetical protein